jgi:putative tryptophan/tyrosine transport system substrate-binding protein
MMTRRTFLCGLTLGTVSAPLAAGAQQTAKIPRIGILRPGSPPDPLVEAFRRGLQELGYTEGRNISIEYRWAEGREERLPSLAADLVRLQVDVIVAGAAAVAVKQATNVIPIVMPIAADPVKLGLVASLARPGGNVTGLTSLSDELPGKWIQLVKEMLPRVSRMAAFWDPAGDPSRMRASEVAARSMDVSIQVLQVDRPDGFESAFIETKKNRSGALIILGSPFFYAYRTRLVELAARHRLPTIYPQREFVEGSGGLMSYGADYHDQFRRAATYVDKILKGAKPADLPVEQPTKFELVINLKTAKALGLTIPPSVLGRADQVIE